MKPIIATNIDGFLLKHEVFFKPHVDWFDRAIKLTGDPSLSRWKEKKDYFIGVDEAMKKIMPQASDKERTEQARKWYQEDVVSYIKKHPEAVYRGVADKLRKWRDKYRLALVTVNSREYIDSILEAAGLEGVYDIVFAIELSEKPDKAELFRKFVREYGEPEVYIAARSKENFEECLKLGKVCIYAAWDEFNPEIEKLATRTFRTVEELVV